MLIFDELRRNDPQLRVVALMVALGLCVLLAGLWWVQVVSASEYQSHLDTQAYRTVRIPAARGKILDRDGHVLAENAASYNLSLYLDDLQSQFKTEFNRLRPTKTITTPPPFWKLWLGKPTVKTVRAKLDEKQMDALIWQARNNVVGSLIAQVSQQIGRPITFDPAKFNRHYKAALAMPYNLAEDLNITEVSRFQEHYTPGMAANLEMEAQRVYPYGTTAGHLLGYVQNSDESISGEDAYFDYRLPDFKGVVGIEGGFDSQLHGRAGAASVTVNNFGFRQAENIWSQPEAGKNVVLTLDLDIQRAAEKSLASHQGTNARAAIVVMNVRTGDVISMVSSPEINPFFASNSAAYLNDPKLKPQINRTTYENYIPGSIFKPIVALAALENGLNPNEIYKVQPDPAEGWHGCIYVGSHKIKDTVPPGDYDLKRAIEQSSNAYFIFNGLRTGIEKIIELGEKFHLGQREDLPTLQDAKGTFPTLERVRKSDWRDGDSANICFGQGEVSVTPMQVASTYSAIANGGTVLWPRLVERIESQDPASGEPPTVTPSGLVRDHIGVSQRSLKLLYDAMMSETEDPAGTGYPAFHRSGSLLNWRVCGKTGTAQVKNEQGQMIAHNYWFASFAPYESPRYAVVVMVQSESGGSGGSVCAPIAHDIYEAIMQEESARTKVAAN